MNNSQTILVPTPVEDVVIRSFVFPYSSEVYKALLLKYGISGWVQYRYIENFSTENNCIYSMLELVKCRPKCIHVYGSYTAMGSDDVHFIKGHMPRSNNELQWESTPAYWKEKMESFALELINRKANNNKERGVDSKEFIKRVKSLMAELAHCQMFGIYPNSYVLLGRGDGLVDFIHPDGRKVAVRCTFDRRPPHEDYVARWRSGMDKLEAGKKGVSIPSFKCSLILSKEELKYIDEAAFFIVDSNAGKTAFVGSITTEKVNSLQINRQKFSFEDGKKWQIPWDVIAMPDKHTCRKCGVKEGNIFIDDDDYLCVQRLVYKGEWDYKRERLQ